MTATCYGARMNLRKVLAFTFGKTEVTNPVMEQMLEYMKTLIEINKQIREGKELDAKTIMQLEIIENTVTTKKGGEIQQEIKHDNLEKQGQRQLLNLRRAVWSPAPEAAEWPRLDFEVSPTSSVAPSFKLLLVLLVLLLSLLCTALPCTTPFCAGKVEDLKSEEEKMATVQKEDLQLLLEMYLEDKNNKQIEEKLKQLIEDPESDIEKSIDEMAKANTELKIEIKKAERELEQPSSYLVKRNIPTEEMKFTSVESPEDDDQYLNISCSFQVTTQLEYELKRGQALITFEDEYVAQNVIKRGKHCVTFDKEEMKLMAKPVPLKTGLIFQVIDKLALSFSKSQNGGGEVEHVEYNINTQTAVITFLQNGVADNILKHKKYPLHTNTSCYQVVVSPHMEKHIKKLQVFSGISKRTVLLTGFKNIQDDEESIEEDIFIHFQKGSNGGGDIDVVKCALKKPQIAYFEADLDEGFLTWAP
ncbi:N-myc-interactor [Gracilinanus agilis]|uniref:N-myc-interactor n=1 Tax=Gracilinanus agilis TaxID=191870 RepID=UPI001CFDA21C|nr:N-myc-interactor [Gracilinanus agilis]